MCYFLIFMSDGFKIKKCKKKKKETQPRVAQPPTHHCRRHHHSRRHPLPSPPQLPTHLITIFYLYINDYTHIKLSIQILMFF